MIKVAKKGPRRLAASLIVMGDDAKAILSSVSEYGISATLYSNVKEASEALGKWHYHAVLCDLKMRGVRQFLQLVRDKFPDVAILVVTHPGCLRLGILATLSGASAYIQTPLEPRTVVSIMERALESKRLASALQDRFWPAR
jgi:DNA-binding NtrC family response regulator